MNRLNFILPDFTRIIWVSSHAKEVWQPRLSRISKSFSQIEFESVLQSKRSAYLYSIDGQRFIETQIEIDSQFDNLSLIPLDKITKTNSYSNTQQRVDDQTEDYNVRCVLIETKYKKQFAEAWKTGNNSIIGKLLGYPQCCIDFFENYWVKEKFLDTTYPMSINGTIGPKECNILWRWTGVRAVSHLPCSFDCTHTYNQAVDNIKFGRQLGFDQEMDWLEQILDWPVQWSALHGIAEIKTPILKISSRTDATADLVIVDRQGFSYPDEGASGTIFPYVNKAKKSITNTQSFSRSVLLENCWKDNGFSTLEGMIHSHNMIIDCIDKSDIKLNSVIDFGCGNAELVKRINDKYHCEIFGIEIDKSRYNRIKMNVSDFENFYYGNMFDQSQPLRKLHYDLAIVMPGRFEENSDKSLEFVEWLKSNVDYVLFYGYGDWLNKLFNTADQEPVKTLKEANLQFLEISKTETDHVICYLGNLSHKQKEINFKIL